jgi:hypothetical protein
MPRENVANSVERAVNVTKRADLHESMWGGKGGLGRKVGRA